VLVTWINGTPFAPALMQVKDRFTRIQPGANMGLILLIILILLLIGGLPRWNYSREWGYGPSSLVSLLVVVLVFLLIFDVVRWGY